MPMVCESPIASGPNKGKTARGTAAGYKRHRKLGEPACVDCLAGASRTTGEWVKANPEKHARSVRNWQRANRVKVAAARKRAYDADPEKYRARARQWYAENREAALESNRRWRAENPEKARKAVESWRRRNPDWNRQYVAKNRERLRRRAREWHAANKSYFAEAERRRRARKKGASVVPFTVEQLEHRLFMFPGCWMCGGDADTVDHVKPLAKGGLHILANLRSACGPCNSSKKDTWPLPDLAA